MTIEDDVSANLIVFNEGGIIERFLKNLQGDLDRIILINNGEYKDYILPIEGRFTDKILIIIQKEEVEL